MVTAGQHPIFQVLTIDGVIKAFLVVNAPRQPAQELIGVASAEHAVVYQLTVFDIAVWAVIRVVEEVPAGHLGSGAVGTAPEIIELRRETGEADIFRNPLIGPPGRLIVYDDRYIVALPIFYSEYIIIASPAASKPVGL